MRRLARSQPNCELLDHEDFLSFEVYCSVLDYAYISLQTVFTQLEQEVLSKVLHYGKHGLTT